MADDGARGKRLGRGLAALLGDMETESGAVERARSQRRLPIEHLRRNPHNPRRRFDEDELAELTASVREKGIVQPIVVRPVGSGHEYEIIAGERRWRAAQAAGLHEVPVVIHEVSDSEALELAIIENVQRTDLNPLEEALGYDRLITEFTYSQNDLAKVIGKSRSHVANTLRLLKLPESVKDYLADGSLTAGHARALITADDAEALARRIVDEGLNVREAEALSQAAPRADGERAAKPKAEKDADTRALEKSLADALGLKVEIAHKDSGGQVKISYKTLEQLDEIVLRLRGS
ncbi:MAG: chromosome partitioning protein ParB [Hyphomicrobiales bacterium]|nr:MAG: chromosome partitioning protein ParB [Hyphomicrobiales bacterium]